MFKQEQVKYLGRQQNSQLFDSKTASVEGDRGRWMVKCGRWRVMVEGWWQVDNEWSQVEGDSSG